MNEYHDYIVCPACNKETGLWKTPEDKNNRGDESSKNVHELFAFYDTQLDRYVNTTDIDDMLDYLQEGKSDPKLPKQEKIALVQEYDYIVMPLDINKLGSLLNFVKGAMPTSVQASASIKDILEFAMYSTQGKRRTNI